MSKEEFKNILIDLFDHTTIIGVSGFTVSHYLKDANQLLALIVALMTITHLSFKLTPHIKRLLRRCRSKN